MKIKEEQVKIYVSYPKKKKNIYIYIYIFVFWDMNYLSCSLALFNYSSPIYLLMKEKKKNTKNKINKFFDGGLSTNSISSLPD